MGAIAIDVARIIIHFGDDLDSAKRNVSSSIPGLTGRLIELHDPIATVQIDSAPAGLLWR